MSQHNRPITPKTVGALLDTTFRLYSRHFLKLIILTICIYVPYLIFEAIFNIDAGTVFTKIASDASSQAEIQQQLLNALPSLTWSGVFTIVSALFIVPLLYGSILHVEARAQWGASAQGDGETNTGWQAFKHAWSRLLLVIGTDIVRWVLYFLATLVAMGVTIGVAALFHAIGFNVYAVTVAAVILGLTAACVLIWLAVKFAFIQSVTLEEGLSFFRSFRRSFEITRGNVWRVIGYMILVQLIVVAVSFGLQLVLNLVPFLVLRTILTSIVGILVTPFDMLAMAVLYLDLRVRSDAPDISAWLQERDSGR